MRTMRLIPPRGTEGPQHPTNKVLRLTSPPPSEPPPPVEVPSPGSEAAGARSVASPWQRAFSFGSMVAVLALSAVGIRAGHQWLTTTSRFGAREVTVTGTVRTTRDEVLDAARISSTRNVLSIDTERTASAVERLPWVEHASVARHLPGRVVLTIVEREATAVVAAGGLYLASADGTLFKRALSGDPVDLPVVTGITREDFERDPDAAREWVRDALALLADLDATALAGRLHVDEVHRETTGDLALVAGGTYVWLGRGPYRAKIARLRVVLAELARHNLAAGEIHLESDRHPERVTVRPR